MDATGILAALAQPAALLDREAVIVATNDEWCRTPRGCSGPQAAAGENYFDLLSTAGPEFQPRADRIAAKLRRVLAGGPPVTDEYGWRTVKERLWFRWRAANIGGPDSQILLTVDDVTTVHHARELAHRSRSHLRAVITGAPIWLFSVDENGLFTLAEGLGSLSMGAGPEVIGKSVFEVYSHVPDLLKSVRSAIAGRSASARVHVGATVFDVKCAPSQGADARPEGAVGIATDVTEQSRLERLKDEFVSIVSHELRTPLTSIHGSLRLLESGTAGTLPAAALELVSIASNNSHRLIRLINDMLDLDKIAAGKLHLSPSTTSLLGLVERAVDEIAVVADQSKVEIVHDVDPALFVKADEDRVVQVLINLLSNAVKFSPSGSRVDVRAEPRGLADVRIEVEDRGAGIAAHQRPRLFQKFQQLESPTTRKHEGTGLGLAISKAIVEAHGGIIDVDSREGAGATFFFTLRRVSQERERAQSTASSDSAHTVHFDVGALSTGLDARPLHVVVAELRSGFGGIQERADAPTTHDELLDLHAQARIASAVPETADELRGALAHAATAIERLALNRDRDDSDWAVARKTIDDLADLIEAHSQR